MNLNDYRSDETGSYDTNINSQLSKLKNDSRFNKHVANQDLDDTNNNCIEFNVKNNCDDWPNGSKFTFSGNQGNEDLRDWTTLLKNDN